LPCEALPDVFFADLEPDFEAPAPEVPVFDEPEAFRFMREWSHIDMNAASWRHSCSGDARLRLLVSSTPRRPVFARMTDAMAT